MREVVINIHCDVCGTQFVETDEGSNSVGLVIYGEQREMDVCDECIHGSFLQEARPVSKRRKKTEASDFPCGVCEKRFLTQGGATRHMTMTHGS